MFPGPTGKQLMIEQGYVPETCTLPDDYAGILIYEYVNKGEDPCAGCNGDRSVCRGRPKADTPRLKKAVEVPIDWSRADPYRPKYKNVGDDTVRKIYDI